MRPSEPSAARTVSVARVMRGHFVALGPEDSLREAEMLMRMGRFRALPVVSAERLAGMLHYAPLLRWCLEACAASPEDVDRRLREWQVAALMDAQPASTAPGAPVGEAAARLVESDGGCLPVVDPEGRLVGILTESDLLRRTLAAPEAEASD
ncbi:MAG TPA: CBS domain-containing protein [Myxococcota bacterium]|nr:CBS domain-containing protein [Myxococcota bacterium]